MALTIQRHARTPARRPTAERHVLTLVQLNQSDPAWGVLLAEAPDATAFHHPAWIRVLSDTYGYRSIVVAEPDLEAGALLARVPRLRGQVWVSLPFSDHCPPLTRDTASLARLTAGIAAWSAREGVPVEVRGALAPASAWTEADIGVRHVLSLTAD